jgi:putative (di)nucleoside polyphosphate hydrolase
MADKYRKCVGMMILNTNKEILVGRRLDHPSGYWQMPQGGIDENENPKEAVWREMMEEIGTNKAKLIRISNQWINYDIPSETLKTLPWGHKYIGQRQKWFAFDFLGEDNDINVGTDNPEFSEWKWTEMDSIVDNIVPFKRKVYSVILEEFKDLLKQH